MKFLFCDFDGTLYRNSRISKEDIQAIIQWQQAGNQFVFATGRDIRSLEEKLRNYPQIKPNYVIGNNGATIGMTSYNKLNKENITNLLKAMNDQKPVIEHIKLSVAIGRQGLELIKIFSVAEALTVLNMNDAELYQMAIQFPTSEAAQVFVSSYAVKYPQCAFLQNIQTVDIVSQHTNKATAIAYLSDELAIASEHVYTIGDGLNDQNMLQQYTSATFPWVAESLKQSATYQVHSVAEWINHIQSATSL
uniref:HAD family hydrolase n=1 Tax=Candidatus Enterococcus willemsii TaxID=1857215 RepID=UPI00403EFA0F